MKLHQLFMSSHEPYSRFSKKLVSTSHVRHMCNRARVLYADPRPGRGPSVFDCLAVARQGLQANWLTALACSLRNLMLVHSAGLEMKANTVPCTEERNVQFSEWLPCSKLSFSSLRVLCSGALLSGARLRGLLNAATSVCDSHTFLKQTCCVWFLSPSAPSLTCAQLQNTHQF